MSAPRTDWTIRSPTMMAVTSTAIRRDDWRTEDTATSTSTGAVTAFCSASTDINYPMGSTRRSTTWPTRVVIVYWRTANATSRSVPTTSANSDSCRTNNQKNLLNRFPKSVPGCWSRSVTRRQ